jgi:hypothetical protein
MAPRVVNGRVGEKGDAGVVEPPAAEHGGGNARAGHRGREDARLSLQEGEAVGARGEVIVQRVEHGEERGPTAS